MNRLFRLYLTMVILLLANFSVHAEVTAVNASVDKNPAMADESIVLTVIAIGDADRDDFDPSILANNFVVGRTSVSSQTRVVNFNTTRSTSWSTILVPRRQGTFTIPAFNIGGKQSQPITMRVISPTSNSGAARDAFVTAELDSNQAYLQQQIRYTVRIHLSTELRSGSLAAPQLENAEISPLGEDREYSDIVDGHRYRIIERNYAIVPQQSGTFTIQGPLFEGEIIDNRRRTFSSFSMSTPINRVAPDTELTVLPIPSDYDQHWLPSEFVQLNEEWQPALDELKVGEPITRTFTLTAVGVVEEQLPEINSNYPPAFKSYPDQPTTATVVKDGTLISQRVENVAVIPSREGLFVLPEVSVPWFNVTTGETQYATLPARSIKVKPGSAISTPLPPAQPKTDEATAVGPEPVESQNPLQIGKVPVYTEIQQHNLWLWISMGLVCLWIVTLLAWWMTARNRSIHSSYPQAPAPETSSISWHALEKALQSNQPQQIHSALKNWLGHLTNKPNATLNESLQRINNPILSDQISQMFARQYRDKASTWKSDKLLAELQRIKNAAETKKQADSILKPLYS